MEQFLDPKIVENIEKAEKHGVDISCLPLGTKIEVSTKNSLYLIECLGGNNIEISGGQYFSESLVVLHGSVWGHGTSMIKNNWIGLDMNMELHFNDNRITTSKVKKIKIIGPNWSYDIGNSENN